MKKDYKAGDSLVMRIRKSDELIMEWASKQSELGDAIRYLIEQEIQNNEITDMAKQIVRNRVILPSANEIKPELLKLLKEKGSLTTKEAYALLGDVFQITEEERTISVRSGRQSQWENNCQWAREYLKQDGYLKLKEYSGWGNWEIKEEFIY